MPTPVKRPTKTKPVHYREGAFPPAKIKWEALAPVIGPAHWAIGRYNGLLAAIPSPDVLLRPMTTKEAVLSSRIEGTQATMEDVLTYEADNSREPVMTPKEADIQEILNYRKALTEAERALNKLPLSKRLLLATHKTLMTGVRGQGKAPGVFRKIPNWIGPPGSTMESARYVPIEASKISTAIGVWEKYIHEDAPDTLVQLALLHAEFEAIHPFLDGNGRLGRMLIPLFLYEKNLLSRPMLNISAYLEAHRDEYYARLLRVSQKSDWEGWCTFFLDAVRLQAEEDLGKAQEILTHYNEMKDRFILTTHSQYAIRALDWIFCRPIFRNSDFVHSAEIPAPTAKRIVRALNDAGILKTYTEGGGRRSAKYILPSLMNIVEGRTQY